MFRIEYPYKKMFLARYYSSDLNSIAFNMCDRTTSHWLAQRIISDLKIYDNISFYRFFIFSGYYLVGETKINQISLMVITS